MQEYASAQEPIIDGMVPHLKCRKGDISDIVLLPGDPGRVKKFGDILENFKIISNNREFIVASGVYEGTPVTVCSTGIGSPSTEIAVVELIKLGAKALIRVGGTGAIQENIECGDLILNTGCVRLGGASSFYARPEYPAVASFDVVQCLKEAAEEMDMPYHVGIGASVSSFYRGQGREGIDMANNSGDNLLIEEFKKLNILNIEMEAETILTLSSIYKIRSGSICVAHCNRVTNKWLIDYDKPQDNLCLIALKAAGRLNKIIERESAKK